ncbi:hypothetical protein GCM10009535_59080 [Streptomyces thermocarboxydovorans]|uniref:HNH nuclease domain-containing protein n=1 Tax=Streptomyces thermocarboxydovorans TaxID=59298 RepID=A0ABN1HX10_9ACTN
MAKVKKQDDGCWIWTGFLTDAGYGKFRVGDKMERAHRWILAHALGRELTADEVACHTCDNRACVRPDHLYAGDTFTNMRDMVSRERRPSTALHADCDHENTKPERQKCVRVNGPKQIQRPGMDPYERFMENVDSETTPDGCHPWIGRKSEQGRGKFGIRKDGKRKQYMATRWLMEHVLGRELKPNEVVRHKCDNPICVRREHLELGTAAENSRDIVERGRNVNAAKTHCKWGHPFDAENTYIQPSTGKRQCKACRRGRPTPASA